MRTSDFDYVLPADRIAQFPASKRTDARLLVVHRQGARLETAIFAGLGGFLREGDLLVVNDSKVIPARLRGRKCDGGGNIEILLLEKAGGHCEWWVMLRPGKRVRAGTTLVFGDAEQLEAIVRAKDDAGRFRLEFSGSHDLLEFAHRHGEVPLPPYINREAPRPEDREHYQTVYARAPGSVAAPTAGLHFSRELLAVLRRAGILTCEVTLHVGLGTFAPVKTEHVETHVMHAESYAIQADAADAIESAKREGRRVIAVGTTTLRVLESVARKYGGRVREDEGRTNLFIRPPAEFQIVDSLLTNFHLPRSTLLMLVSAFAAPGSTKGRDLILNAYREAMGQGFRFFSYGDAMLLL